MTYSETTTGRVDVVTNIIGIMALTRSDIIGIMAAPRSSIIGILA